MLSIFGRASVSKVTAPLGKALIRTGLTPDAVTIIGTVATIAAAVTLFPIGLPVLGTLVIWLFVMFDMLDGAMARPAAAAPSSARCSTPPATGSPTVRSSPDSAGGPCTTRNEQAAVRRDPDLPGHLAGDLVRQGARRGQRPQRRTAD